MAILFVHYLDPSIANPRLRPVRFISGPRKWRASQGKDLRRTRNPDTGKKGPPPSDLLQLWAAAERGELDRHWIPTPAGEALAEEGCKCNDGQPLRRLPLPTPPPEPVPGVPSRNRPCNTQSLCKSDTLVKWCEGTPERPHPLGKPPMPSDRERVGGHPGEPQKASKAEREKARRVAAADARDTERAALLVRLAALDVPRASGLTRLEELRQRDEERARKRAETRRQKKEREA